MLQILDKMILPLGTRVKKYSSETGSSAASLFPPGSGSKITIFSRSSNASPTSSATFQAQVLELGEEEGAYGGNV